jgi:CRISPR-associated exonuclease Cas4
VFDEEDLLAISALSQFLFCPRRAALIFLEGQWEDNVATAEGIVIHDRAHEPETEARADLRIARSLRLRSLRLGLSGVADVVEFHRMPDDCPRDASGPPEDIALAGASGRWRPFPVEYKRGKRRHERGFEVQLCAQGICLEEMLACQIPAGALFYAKTNRRLDVPFDQTLRQETELAAVHLRAMLAAQETPPAVFEKKCWGCSMFARCEPKTTEGNHSAATYLSRALAEVERGRDAMK